MPLNTSRQQPLRWLFFFLTVVIWLAMIGGCAGPRPLGEFTLAHTAINAAQYFGAPHLAPKLWYEADRHYRKGVKLFKDNARHKARAHFVKARTFAEKAENVARVKKFQSGDSLP